MIPPASSAMMGLTLHRIPGDFRPNPAGDQPADDTRVRGFMDYTDDCVASVADGTSNTIFGP